jgi:hypothetical protein
VDQDVVVAGGNQILSVLTTTETNPTTETTKEAPTNTSADITSKSQTDSGELASSVSDSTNQNSSTNVFTTGLADLDKTSWPQWLGSAIEYLEGISDNVQWKALLIKLIFFETNIPDLPISVCVKIFCSLLSSHMLYIAAGVYK